MKALVFKRYGKADQLAFIDTPRPTPKPDEILVQVHAAGPGPPDAAFARARVMNVFMVFLFGLLSRKIIRGARKRGAEYSFLFVHPDGSQLSQIAEILEADRIRPVIDRVFPFAQTKEALAYLAKGRAKGKVVVQMS